MRVFVLTTGRAGSMTFAASCAHITNFTSAHESLAQHVGDARFAYPDHHIEVDNRLSWLTGSLAERFPDAGYVHLTRNEEAVADSFGRRWRTTGGARGVVRHLRRYGRPGAGLMDAFANGIILRNEPWAAGDRPEVARFMVQAINANIRAFLAGRPHVTVCTDSGGTDFAAFWDWLGAEGDREAALREWEVRHNAT